jgi:hypothetical protein
MKYAIFITYYAIFQKIEKVLGLFSPDRTQPQKLARGAREADAAADLARVSSYFPGVPGGSPENLHRSGLRVERKEKAGA